MRRRQILGLLSQQHAMVGSKDREQNKTSADAINAVRDKMKARSKTERKTLSKRKVKSPYSNTLKPIK